MPDFISRAAADFVMSDMGYAVHLEEGQAVTYRWLYGAGDYEILVSLSFPDDEHGMPEADFRRELSDYQGIPLAVIDAALEQL